MTQIDFPYAFDGRRRTAAPPDDDAHIRDLIEQVLFTVPGERVNRPDFGSGLMQLVFQPNGVELAAATEFLVRNALQQWLGDLIEVEEVAVEARDSTLQVTIGYLVRRSQTRSTAQLTRSGAP
jgi:phage baseplate assembly protein W